MPEYVNPNEGKVRIASTSGHVVFVGDKPINILSHMEEEARAKGCLPLSSYKALEEKIRAQVEQRNSGNSDTQAATADSGKGQEVFPQPGQAAQPKATANTGGITEEPKLQKVVEALELMLDADNDDYFTGNGLPRATAVSELAGFDVSKELREKAWEIVKAKAAQK